MITVYGIRNCDKIKRTLAWFEAQGIAVRFHDYRKDGLTESDLKAWMKAVDWSSLINRAGTTWRALPEDLKQSITSAQTARRVMASHPALIKRPLIVSGDTVHVGYEETEFQRLYAC